MIQKQTENLRIFRDDLYPYLGGGNKGRKIMSISKDISKKKCNAVVTTGGINSNHCRALSIVCKQNKWDCTLILHGDKDEFYSSKGNALIMRAMKPKLIFSEVSKISKNMDLAMDKYKKDGYRPYYLWGGGHTLEGGIAYIDAVEELSSYCIDSNWFPDYIFLASGTGSTQAGIISGLDKFKLNSQVIGVSIARERDYAEKNITDFYKKLNNQYNIKSFNKDVIVLDDYLFGGYEQFNKELKVFSDLALSNYGFILDTTYSGKAFFGMLDYIKKNKLSDENILFWHTGGVLNFLS